MGVPLGARSRSPGSVIGSSFLGLGLGFKVCRDPQYHIGTKHIHMHIHAYAHACTCWTCTHTHIYTEQYTSHTCIHSHTSHMRISHIYPTYTHKSHTRLSFPVDHAVLWSRWARNAPGTGLSHEICAMEPTRFLAESLVETWWCPGPWVGISLNGRCMPATLVLGR